MTHVLQLLDEALIAKIIGEPGINQLVSGRVYDVQQPMGTRAPYIIVQYMVGGDMNTSPRDDVECQYWVYCWSSSKAEAYKLIALVRQALHRQNLDVQGWSVYWMACKDFVSRVEWGDDNRWFQTGMTLELRADKKTLS